MEEEFLGNSNEKLNKVQTVQWIRNNGLILIPPADFTHIGNYCHGTTGCSSYNIMGELQY